jgi:hypothetical protein
MDPDQTTTMLQQLTTPLPILFFSPKHRHQGQIILDQKHLDWARSQPELSHPYTRETPWHTQIHRESFQYGEVGDSVDQRLVIHLRVRYRCQPFNSCKENLTDDVGRFYCSGMASKILSDRIASPSKTTNQISGGCRAQDSPANYPSTTKRGVGSSSMI